MRLLHHKTICSFFILGMLALGFLSSCTKSEEGHHEESTPAPPPASTAPEAPPPASAPAATQPTVQRPNCAQKPDGSIDPQLIGCEEDKADTGFTTIDGYKFTGTGGNDNLLSYLKTILVKDQSEDRRNQDAVFAQSIMDAKIMIDEEGSSVSVSIAMDSESGHRQLTFGGRFRPGGEEKLKLKSDDAKTSPSFRASILCLDTDQTCETSLLKMRIGPSDAVSTAYILFRSTGAQLYFTLPEEPYFNSDYKLIDDFLYASKFNIDRKNRTTEVLAQSFEVSNGRSGFRVGIVASSGEVVGFSGPLLAPESGISLDLPVAVGNDWIPSEINQCAKAPNQRRQMVCSPIASRLQNAKMIKNNGRGQIVIRAGIGSAPSNTPNIVTLQFMFKSKPAIGLDLNKLKN